MAGINAPLMAAGGGELSAEEESVAATQCFPADTPVQMADGTTAPIQDVQTGDTVVSRDPVTGQTQSKTVTRTFQHIAPETVTVELADAQTGQVAQTLTATPGHPFFVLGQGFVPLGQLGIGMQVVTRAGPPLVVSSLVRHSGGPGTVV